MGYEQDTRERRWNFILSSFKQLDMPGNNLDPVNIVSEFTPHQDAVEEIYIVFRADCYVTLADDLEQAKTQIDEPSNRRLFIQNESESFFLRRQTKRIFARAVGVGGTNLIDKEIYKAVEVTKK